MRRTAALVETWRSQGRDGVLARPIDAQGLGPRSSDDVVLVDDQGRAAGSLLGGLVNESVVTAGRQLQNVPSLAHVLVEIDIAFDDATAVGLTCGGHVHVLLSRRRRGACQDEVHRGRRV